MPYAFLMTTTTNTKAARFEILMGGTRWGGLYRSRANAEAEIAKWHAKQARRGYPLSEMTVEER